MRFRSSNKGKSPRREVLDGRRDSLDQNDPTVRVGAAVRVSDSGPPSAQSFEMDGSAITVHHISTGLNAAEAARARTIGLIFVVISAVSLTWLPFLEDGLSSSGFFFGATLMVFAAMGLYVWKVAVDVEKYTPLLFRTFGMTGVITAFAALIFLGPFSPTTLVVTLGIGFFGQGRDRWGAWLICLTSISLTAILFICVLTGLVEDIGVFRGSDAGLAAMLFMALMVPLVLSVTFLQARWSRQVMESAMGSAVSALMDINLKKVQLEEAQAEIDRIFGNDGLNGRHTGAQIEEYRLGPLLGRGASGEVYDAVDQANGRRAALKLLTSQYAEEAIVIARFKREARIASQIRSPYVAQVYGFGQDATGMRYIAMERLEGEDLAAILRRRGRLSGRVCHRLLQHICQGLAAAHERVIIHRDVKPHNIYFHRRSETKTVWKILDFGVSKWMASETLTSAGCVVGTPRYMAPEQALGKELDRRSDIYAAGAVLYRCLTGAPPFQNMGINAIAAAAYRRPLKPRIVAPDLDPQLEAVLSIAMAPDPSDRFSNAAEFANAYDAAYRGRLDPRHIEAARSVPWSETT